MEPVGGEGKMWGGEEKEGKGGRVMNTIGSENKGGGRDD